MNDFLALTACTASLIVAFAVMARSRCARRHDWGPWFTCRRCGTSALDAFTLRLRASNTACKMFRESER